MKDNEVFDGEKPVLPTTVGGQVLGQGHIGMKLLRSTVCAAHTHTHIHPELVVRLRMCFKLTHGVFRIYRLSPARPSLPPPRGH